MDQPNADPQPAPPTAAPLTAAAVAELIEELSQLDRRFLEGDRAQSDLPTVLEGYRWMFSILSVGLETFLWGDTTAPRFTDIVGFNRKWGGDNSDAFYQYAPLDPAGTYRVTGTVADAVYFSISVYGGPDDGRYSERIVGSASDRTVAVDDDGGFEIWLSPNDPAPEDPGAAAAADATWVRLEPDAVCAVTRDYLPEPTRMRRMTWQIERIDPPEGWSMTDEDEARRYRAALTWVREQAAMVPVVLADENTVLEPYPVPTTTFGWAAGDAAYAMGAYRLGPDQALVIEGRSPECSFWNICLWNPFLHTYNYDHGQVTLNGHQATYEPDGSWRIVIAPRDPGQPNWVDTQGHEHGLIWFRWFHPAETPERPTAKVIELD